MKPILIVIAGGSASGKSTVVEELIDRLSNYKINVIRHDDYYKCQDHLSLDERVKTNYDHPDSLDNDLLCQNIKDLLDGKEIDKPLYDFVIHTRKKETEHIIPTKVIILEGILSLAEKKIRDLADIKIFVSCDADIRILRRLYRDIEERGRTLQAVTEQYLTTVKPMYHQFVSPSKRYADIIIPNDRKHDVALDFLVSRVKDIIKEEE